MLFPTSLLGDYADSQASNVPLALFAVLTAFFIIPNPYVVRHVEEALPILCPYIRDELFATNLRVLCFIRIHAGSNATKMLWRCTANGQEM